MESDIFATLSRIIKIFYLQSEKIVYNIHYSEHYSEHNRDYYIEHYDEHNSEHNRETQLWNYGNI